VTPATAHRRIERRRASRLRPRIRELVAARNCWSLLGGERAATRSWQGPQPGCMKTSTLLTGWRGPAGMKVGLASRSGVGATARPRGCSPVRSWVCRC